MHPSRGSYTELWNNLWGASEQRDVYLCKYDPPPGGSKNSALTYESYDFSSLRSTVLPGHATNFTVRQEYRTLYQTLNDWYTLRPGNQLIRGVVVTGHPGIGKSISLWYILVQRLYLRQPTVIEFDGELFLFHHRGVTGYTKEISTALPVLGREVWVLVDSNDIVQGPWWRFTRSDAFIVQAISPPQSRYYQWTKEIGLTRTWTMDVWSLEELEFTSDYVWKYSEDKKQALRRSFQFFGPVVRIAKHCLDPDDFESQAEDIVSNLPVGITAFTTGLRAARNSYDTGSHHWCLVIPKRLRLPQATFVSVWVMKLIMEEKNNATADFLHAMYEATTAMPAMGTMAGKMFEAIAHTMLCNGRNTATGLGHSDTFLLDFTENDRSRMSFTKLQELGKECQADGTCQWLSIYAQPTTLSFATADSIAIINGRLYIFQVTTNYLHNINILGLEQIYNGLPDDLRPTQETPLRFVWVIPFDKSRDFDRRNYVGGPEEQKNRWDSLAEQYVIKLTMGRDDFINSKIKPSEIANAINWELAANDLQKARSSLNVA